MPPTTPGGAPNSVPLAPRLTLHSPSSWHVARPGPFVLGEEDPISASVPLDLFSPAEPAITITIEQTAQPAVLGEEAEQSAELAYQPTENAVYVLLQELHTPD